MYNLAFGDRNADTGEIDDLVVSNNSDTDNVLATIIAALYDFFDKHPNAFVYATGSIKARTRLYRIGITRFHEEMTQDFELYGQIGDEFYIIELVSTIYLSLLLNTTCRGRRYYCVESTFVVVMTDVVTVALPGLPTGAALSFLPKSEKWTYRFGFSRRSVSSLSRLAVVALTLR